MARLTKQHLIDAVAEKTGLTKKQSGAALNAVLDTIQGALANGDSVGLIGFGTFEVRERAARDGRNPQTGAPIKIPAKTVPAFKAGKQLKDAVG
ncbi:TPA: HU family DNA-binding protein [Candidatus Poribacteria bacterium]|nr:HU family DNA-binding protein [Candidatus Poribacteria bacterium]